jgi:hypothetical protein
MRRTWGLELGPGCAACLSVTAALSVGLGAQPAVAMRGTLVAQPCGINVFPIAVHRFRYNVSETHKASPFSPSRVKRQVPGLSPTAHCAPYHISPFQTLPSRSRTSARVQTPLHCDETHRHASRHLREWRTVNSAREPQPQRAGVTASRPEDGVRLGQNLQSAEFPWR